MHQLRTYLNAYHDFSADNLRRIEAAFVPKTYRKGEFLLQAGQTDRYIWFIEHGVLRIYEETIDAVEQTFHFVSAGQFMADPDSFNQQTPALVSIQALTDCHAIAISYDGFQRLLRDVPAWGITVQRITEKVLMEKMQKRNRLLYENAKARYQRLITEQPDVVQQVSLGIIASYLAITLPSLSRLRKQLATEHA